MTLDDLKNFKARDILNEAFDMWVDAIANPPDRSVGKIADPMMICFLTDAMIRLAQENPPLAGMIRKAAVRNIEMSRGEAMIETYEGLLQRLVKSWGSIYDAAGNLGIDDE